MTHTNCINTSDDKISRTIAQEILHAPWSYCKREVCFGQFLVSHESTEYFVGSRALSIARDRRGLYNIYESRWFPKGLFCMKWFLEAYIVVFL